MRIMKLALTALFAVLAFSVLAASSASAFHPLFLTLTGTELLFLGKNPAGVHPVLRALNAGVLGTITCENVLVDGFALNKSTLAHRVVVEFHGKCELHSSLTGLVACTENIVVKKSLAELGLILGNKTVGILVAPSDGTNVFTTVTCGSNVTTVEGAVVGIIPEEAINIGRQKQYNSQLSEIEVVFESEGKNSDIQKPEAIELLGVSMTGVELKVQGFFGGRASEEATTILHSGKNGKIEICTKAPSACP